MEAVSDVSDSEDLERGLALGLGSAFDILWVGGDMDVILTNLGLEYRCDENEKMRLCIIC